MCIESAINWCNENQGFAMVLLTLVYVIATIIICIFNYKSAKATTEQTEESIRQFEELNRAFLSVTIAVIKNGLLTLCIENHGNQIAYDTKIKFNKEFLNIMKDDLGRESFEKLQNSCFIVGINQKWHTFIDVSANINTLKDCPLQIELSYRDNRNSYIEKSTIDFGQYNWALEKDSVMDDIRISQNKISKSIEKISKDINRYFIQREVNNDK